MANRAKPEPEGKPGVKYYVIVEGSRFNESDTKEEVIAAINRWWAVGVPTAKIQMVTTQEFTFDDEYL